MQKALAPKVAFPDSSVLVASKEDIEKFNSRERILYGRHKKGPQLQQAIQTQNFERVLRKIIKYDEEHVDPGRTKKSVTFLHDDKLKDEDLSDREKKSKKKGKKVEDEKKKSGLISPPVELVEAHDSDENLEVASGVKFDTSRLGVSVKKSTK